MRASRVLAVDCGASRVACGLFTRTSGGQLTLERIATEPLSTRDSNDEQWAAEVGAALEAIAHRTRLQGTCVVGMPGHLTFTKLIQVPPISARQRRKITCFEARQGVPFALDQVVWTSAVLSKIENGFAVALTAARRPLIEALCTRMRTAGFYPSVVLPPWFGLRHGAGGPPAANSSPTLCIGARSTQLIFGGENRFFLRSFALGGNMVTQRIADELEIDFAQAEALKRRMLGGTPVVPHDGPENMAMQIATEQFVRRLSGEMQRSLASLFPEGDKSRPPVLRLTGGGSLMPELPKVLSERLQMRVEHCPPVNHLKLGDAVAEADEAVTAARIGDLAGLVAGAASRECAEVDLLPRMVRWRMLGHRWRTWLAAAAMVMVIGLPAPILHFRSSAAATHLKTGKIEAKIDQARRLDARNRANLAHVAEITHQIAILQKVAREKGAWGGFFSNLQEQLTKTEDVWLETLLLLPPAKLGKPSGSDRPTTKRGPLVENDSVERTDGSASMRLKIAGCIFDAENPETKAGATCYQRAKSLLSGLRELPFVAAVENERFDGGEAGMLRFEITLVPAPGTLF